MKIRVILLVFIFCLIQSCGVFSSQESFAIKNQYGRVQLKEMKLKKTFDKSRIDLIDVNALYYYNRKNTNIDMEFNFIIRFFENGQFAILGGSQKPIVQLSYEDIDYNDLDRAGYVGYYNIKDNIITLEYPNQLFRRSGKRNLDKYYILPNGDLESITKAASNYGAVYKKIVLSDKSLKEIVPDW